jgi:hypothetical protein
MGTETSKPMGRDDCLKHSILCLIIASCAFLGMPRQLQAASKVAYFTHDPYVTEANRQPPHPSRQYWTQGNDVPSSTKTYHSPEVALSTGDRYLHHQDFFVVLIHLSTSPLSHATYLRYRPRDPPAL